MKVSRILVLAMALLGLFVGPASARGAKMGTICGTVHVQGYSSWPTNRGPLLLRDAATGYTTSVMPQGDTFTVRWPLGKHRISAQLRYCTPNLVTVHVGKRHPAACDFGILLTYNENIGHIDGALP